MKTHRRRLRFLPFVAFSGAALACVLVARGSAAAPPAGPAAGSDGRIVIDRLPYTINACGSYVLHRCLQGVPGEAGITIRVSHVTLDLNGFSLLGVPGTLDGIVVPVTASPRRDVVIRNGSLVGWGEDGLDARGAADGRYEDLRAYDNAFNGLTVGPDATVFGCHADANGVHGIESTGGGGIIDRCTATHSGVHGIVTSRDGTIVCKSVARGNAQSGFKILSSDLVEGCVASENYRGFHIVGIGNRVEENLATRNDVGYDAQSTTNLILRNGANNNGVEYDLFANDFGAILADPGPGFVNEEPWVNFEF